MTPLMAVLNDIQTLLSLKIESSLTDQLVVNSILERIYKNHNLVEVVFITGIGLNHPFLDLSIRQMAINCSKLKRFEFVVTFNKYNTSMSGQLLSAFKQFKELEYLGLNIERSRDCYQWLTSEELKGFENLTHLRLISNNYRNIYFSLNDIHYYLPNLLSISFQ